MSELTIEQLIKIILGVLVFIAVVIALYLFFKNQVISFFEGFGGNSTGIFWSLLK
ncbi:MAG TPA: hypothetical protein VMC07_02055 [Candidatus Omnitrophota bacterium]|nr:hypothetical protein [Candidatus Omnitrophota bacterium]